MHRRAIALVALTGTLFVGCSSGSAGPFFVRLSGRMPTVSGTTLGGGSFGPGEYTGKVVVVNFWNYDCPPCRQEQLVLQRDWTALRSKGVSFVGIMFVGGIPPWPDDHSAARAYLRSVGVTYPAIVDEGSSISTAFDIPGIPTTVIADRYGQLRFRILGQVRPGQIEQLVAGLA
jgi:thiol-disulfide isomerase/thioredoxin